MPSKRSAPLPLLGPALEPLYRAAVARRNDKFDAAQRVSRFEIPIISVGNISVGGTGKTPMVRWIVSALRGLGAQPAVVMRGYARKKHSISDEQQEHTDRLPGTPVAANPVRTEAIRQLIDANHADCIVLDDGFQHRFVARDLDIVLIDATRSPFADRCLPAGWLREPVASLRRAGVIVVTRSDQAAPTAIDHLREQLRRAAPGALIVSAAHHWSSLEYQDTRLPLDWLRGRPTTIACAIGNPKAFIAQARDHGARIIDTLIKRDHHDWSRRDADRLIRSGAARKGVLLTTHKDWVKWRRLGDDTINRIAVRPVVEMSIPPDEADALLDRLKNLIRSS